MASNESERSSRYREWLERQRRVDPELFASLSEEISRLAKKDASTVLESPAPGHEDVAERRIVLETIVRRGRPALLVKGNETTFTDSTFDPPARLIVERLREAQATVDKVIPLVGRIDVANYPRSAPYAGTGWLVDHSVIITNRHVADLVARHDGTRFVFRPGRFGRGRIGVSVDFYHEHGSQATDVYEIDHVIWIEPNERNADLALLAVKPGPSARGKIELATNDPAEGTFVATIGYPARAFSDAIPDQELMNKLYGGVFEVKRVAPGYMTPPSEGWVTHDCTTLGGNSGSVVVDAGTGEAVALHFAGLYMVENYAVPASTIRKVLKDQPWRTYKPEVAASSHGPAQSPHGPLGTAPPRTTLMAAGEQGNTHTITFPLTLTVALGTPVVGATLSVGEGMVAGSSKGALGVDDAVDALASSIRDRRVYSLRPGFHMEGDVVTDQEVVVVAADPMRVAEVRAELPAQFRGFAVEVRPASIHDQLARQTVVTEAPGLIEYNDEDRKGERFSFAWVEEKMKVTAHVGPENSWKILQPFLAAAKKELISSIYEFDAEHIIEEIAERLATDVDMTLVVAPQSRGKASTFRRWKSKFPAFKHIFVPIGGGGLVRKSYHIKVTVRDDAHVWLSSGNWKSSSQPQIDDDADPRTVSNSGNREWHIVLENPTLAARFKNHILADFAQSRVLGGKPESVSEEELFVDVPIDLLQEAVELEAPAQRLLPPLEIDREVRVKPLLTPDRKGEVYTKAVLDLIESAEEEIVFQNQYIMMSTNQSPNLDKLVDALIEKANDGVKVRIIVRTGGDTFKDDVAVLRRRGLKVNSVIRRIPKTHTKGIVVDGKRVLVGSQNWSGLAVSENRDASLIFEDEEVAGYFLDAFNIDWERAPSMKREGAEFGVPSDLGARLAHATDPVPPGFRRIPLDDYLEG